MVNFEVKGICLGILLSRGYNELATDEDQPSDISHLVFIAHGIGQTLGNITWDCIRCCSLS